jgi:GNAT superfamily N-acetyltransferase
MQEALRAEHQPLDPRYRISDDAPARWSADLRTWVRSDADRILVADAGPAGLVGLAVAHLSWPAPIYVQRLMVWVDDLYVVPPWRGRGVGRALLDHLGAWGRAAGATELRAGVLAANEQGRLFWSAAGGTDFSVTVAMPLTPPPG